MATQDEKIKWVEGTPFMVDGFRFTNPKCKHYLLTHFHSGKSCEFEKCDFCTWYHSGEGGGTSRYTHDSVQCVVNMVDVSIAPTCCGGEGEKQQVH